MGAEGAHAGGHIGWQLVRLGQCYAVLRRHERGRGQGGEGEVGGGEGVAAQVAAPVLEAGGDRVECLPDGGARCTPVSGPMANRWRTYPDIAPSISGNARRSQAGTPEQL